MSLEDAINNLEGARGTLDEEVQSELLGIRPTFLGRPLRPVRLSTLALLQQSGNDIVSGKPIAECKNMVIDCCKFVLLQSIPLREAVKLVEDPEELRLRAYELAEEIDPEHANGFVDAIISLVSKSQENRVEPIPEHIAKEELTIESMGES